MRQMLPWITASALLSAAVVAFVPASRADGANDDLAAIIKQYLAAHPEDVAAIVKDYVMAHPDMLRDSLLDVMKRQPAGTNVTPDAAVKPDAAPNPSVAIKDNAGELFKSPHQVTLGDPHGDVTMVEFFDYNCGFCKGALPAMLTLLQDDHKLKVVLKEFPILGPGSVEAAHVAVAVRMQDPDGKKYLEFHRKLLGDPGQANKEKALAAAKAAGLNVARLEKDMDSGEVGATIDEDFALARALGISGTPGYVIGDSVIPGAIGLDGLKDKIASARGHAN
jgi:protein-disulfide isomerase